MPGYRPRTRPSPWRSACWTRATWTDNIIYSWLHFPYRRTATMPQATAAGTADVNGVALHYETFGDGEPIILVGGSGLGRPNLAPVEPYLEPHFTVLAFDQRGYGASGSEGLADATIETWVDDLVGLMDVL